MSAVQPLRDIFDRDIFPAGFPGPFPPSRTMVVSDPIPPGANTARWFTTPQAAINAAVTQFAPVSGQRALVLVAPRAGGYPAFNCAPYVDVKALTPNAPQTSDGTDNTTPVQAKMPLIPIAGLISYVTTGDVPNATVFVDGFECTDLSVDFSSQAVQLAGFYFNGRCLGQALVNSGAAGNRNVFQAAGSLGASSPPQTVSLNGAGLRAYLSEALCGNVNVSDGVYCEAENGRWLGDASVGLNSELNAPGLRVAGILAVSDGATIDAPTLEVTGDMIVASGGAAVTAPGCKLGNVDIQGDASADFANGSTNNLTCDAASTVVVGVVNGTLTARGLSTARVDERVEGDVVQEGDASIDIDGCTVNAGVLNSGTNVLHASCAQVQIDIRNTGDGQIVCHNAVALTGQIRNEGGGSIVGHGAECLGGPVLNTGAGLVSVKKSQSAAADNEPTGPGAVIRDQTGNTGALVGAGPHTVPIPGAPYTAGTDYRVLLQQTAGVAAPVMVTAQGTGSFEITGAAAGDAFAFELVAV